MPRYWIMVAARSHVQDACAGGFIQLGSGRWAGYLQRMAPGDRIVCYSPAECPRGNDPCQRFTALGEVRPGDIYRVRLHEDFAPYRRAVNFEACREISARALLGELSFIHNKRAWGARFRRTCFEIQVADYLAIRRVMKEGGQT